MTATNRTNVGDILADWQNKPGFVTEVVHVMSGRMPAFIDITLPPRGCSTGDCSLWGGSRGSKHTPPKEQQP